MLLLARASVCGLQFAAADVDQMSLDIICHEFDTPWKRIQSTSCGIFEYQCRCRVCCSSAPTQQIRIFIQVPDDKLQFARVFLRQGPYFRPVRLLFCLCAGKIVENVFTCLWAYGLLVSLVVL